MTKHVFLVASLTVVAVLTGRSTTTEQTNEVQVKATSVDESGHVFWKADRLTTGNSVKRNVAHTSFDSLPFLNTVEAEIETGGGHMVNSLPAAPIAGRHYIYAVDNPETWDGKTSDTGEYISTFEGADWLALFGDTLKCPLASDLPHHNEPYNPERYKLAFEQSIPAYPLLARMWNTYADVLYVSAEIAGLREECISIRQSTSEEPAGQALEKLIKACDKSLTSHRGLYLASD